MFTFNYNVDKYALKPVARGYRAVVPEQAQIMISNAVNNITWVPRFINSLLQGKWEGALREVSRFVLNSTLGFGGLFDPGKVAGLGPSQEGEPRDENVDGVCSHPCRRAGVGPADGGARDRPRGHPPSGGVAHRPHGAADLGADVPAQHRVRRPERHAAAAVRGEGAGQR